MYSYLCLIYYTYYIIRIILYDIYDILYVYRDHSSDKGFKYFYKFISASVHFVSHTPVRVKSFTPLYVACVILTSL